MKYSAILFLSLILFVTSCKKDKAPTPSTTPVTTPTSMTPFEASLVGHWKLKRSETRTNQYFPGLGDSTFVYKNHYNYLNSQLYLSATLVSGTTQYEGIMGTDDVSLAQTISWCGDVSNTITMGNNLSICSVHYLSTDSLVLDFAGGQARYFYNKTTTPLALNNIESQLLGSKWTLTSFNGAPASYYDYKTFFNNWYTDEGYYSKDSTFAGGVASASPSSWEVLFPNRTSPILKAGSVMGNDGWFKITSLTPTSMTLEDFNVLVNTTTINTYVYTR